MSCLQSVCVRVSTAERAVTALTASSSATNCQTVVTGINPMKTKHVCSGPPNMYVVIH